MAKIQNRTIGLAGPDDFKKLYHGEIGLDPILLVPIVRRIYGYEIARRLLATLGARTAGRGEGWTSSAAPSHASLCQCGSI